MYDSTRLRIGYIMIAIALQHGLKVEEVFAPLQPVPPPRTSPPTYATVLATSLPKTKLGYNPTSPLRLPAHALLSNTAPPTEEVCVPGYRAHGTSMNEAEL
jgi:hypothetical protein